MLKIRTDVSMASRRLYSGTMNKEDDFTLAYCQKLMDAMNVPLATYVK